MQRVQKEQAATSLRLPPEGERGRQPACPPAPCTAARRHPFTRAPPPPSHGNRSSAHPAPGSRYSAAARTGPPHPSSCTCSPAQHRERRRAQGGASELGALLARALQLADACRCSRQPAGASPEEAPAYLDGSDVQVHEAGRQVCACPQLGRGWHQRRPHPRVLVQQVLLDDLAVPCQGVAIPGGAAGSGRAARDTWVATACHRAQGTGVHTPLPHPHAPHLALGQRRAVWQHQQRHLALRVAGAQVLRGAQGAPPHPGRTEAHTAAGRWDAGTAALAPPTCGLSAR